MRVDAYGPDEYKRVLAVVRDEQINVNLLMVAMGYAEVYRGAPCQLYCRELKKAEYVFLLESDRMPVYRGTSTRTKGGRSHRDSEAGSECPGPGVPRHRMHPTTRAAMGQGGPVDSGGSGAWEFRRGLEQLRQVGKASRAHVRRPLGRREHEKLLGGAVCWRLGGLHGKEGVETFGVSHSVRETR